MKKILAVLIALVMVVALAVPALAETVPEATEAAPEVTEVAPEDAEAAPEDAEAAPEEEEPYTGIATASSLITIGVLLAAMVVALVFSAKRVKWDAALIAKAALCIALAYLLSMITLWRAPMGGSVTLVSILPLILFAVAYGPLEGLLIGFAFGLLQLLIDPYVIHPIQLLVDYPMAYGAVALACLGMALPLPEKAKLPAAVVFGYLGRYIMAVISGVVFFAEYAGEQGALVYSLGYNIGYLWPEIVACMILTCIPGVAKLPELLRKNSMR